MSSRLAVVALAAASCAALPLSLTGCLQPTGPGGAATEPATTPFDYLFAGATPEAAPRWTQKFHMGPVSDRSAVRIAVEPSTSGGLYVAVPGMADDCSGSRHVSLHRIALDSTGGSPAEAWTTQVGSTGDDDLFAVAASTRAAYVGGVAHGLFSGSTSPGGFVARVERDGLRNWVYQFPEPAQTEVSALATGADGVVYAAGLTEPRSGHGAKDVFLAAIDGESGGLKWLDRFGTGSGETAARIAVIGGRIFVAGTTQGSFSGGPAPAAADAYLSAFDDAGNWSWVTQASTAAAPAVLNVLPSAGGNAQLVGVLANANIFGQGYTAASNLVAPFGFGPWTTGGIPSAAAAGAVLAGPDGDVFVAGGDDGHLYAAQFSPAGALRAWRTRSVESPEVHRPGCVATDLVVRVSSGHVIAAEHHVVPPPPGACGAVRDAFLVAF